MMLLTLILMSVVIGGTFPSGQFQYYLEDESPSESSERAERGAPPRPPQISMSAAPLRNPWWISERPYSKRRQNMAYYNLNSFGLRYGKRQQKIPAGLTGQKIPLN